ncbi:MULTISPECIES: bifunctional 4-hydroxy-2-oxoglutarate aldolase/2-dehydro-3-deoxy-phosphogluconate aldolase [Pacificibacter]|uniref:bifunctional 4-hydroxy-2-oxoglutarate aldolase/2-dehydro-3-deoxy-phosphogluconate aldolase n=1 Tax=Pacificibacter TaxID=1042323 RepID=UPI001C096312|nr:MULTISPECIES: bifunctional 4-hydroxy-2-oxoglutarate aldolase/2-dehydro-3-deoxy-phosphogluconate aldolase [Pacificibacter]MBU2937158.1 bifunctional 4-hydroxy-2-oxoglutarate aldolase/2-dehydro-3-deoxy-phosphogluconate aldolase [Pacificibacter marinus]MDO6617022.1 bifunctional 4-hydroxy-2-oxoglutarate aldolase/2-dehydro-3-deoxy-phosphogluconate aldolase [Pacificibacter sp. 1_MG-2023]
MSIFDTLSTYGVVPVIAIDDAKDALPLADALVAGGLPVAEITFRTPAAAAAIMAMARHRPDVQVGAGTVLIEEHVDAALEAGARFGLAPGVDGQVVQYATSRGLPFAPGIMTPSDLQIALRAGCKMVKFFPAMPAGGPNMLKNIAAPYSHTGMGYNPTGGVTLDNLADWLALPDVRAVGGTWIATRADIAAGNWDRIRDNAAQAVARVAEIRGQK